MKQTIKPTTLILTTKTTNATTIFPRWPRSDKIGQRGGAGWDWAEFGPIEGRIQGYRPRPGEITTLLPRLLWKAQ